MHKEFVPSGQIVNGEFWCGILRWLRENVRCKWPEISKNRDWLLHHDNAPAHTSLVVWQIITWPLFPTLPTHLTWPPAISTCYLQWNSGWKGGFCIYWRDPSTITTGTKHANAGRLQPLLPKMAKSLGLLYTSPRWLIQRWRWKLGFELSIHVITSKFSEILGTILRIFPCVFD